MNRKHFIVVVAVVLVLLAFIFRPTEPVNDTVMVGQMVPAHFQTYRHGALLDASTLLHTYTAPGGRFRAAADANGVVRMIIPVSAGYTSPEGISQRSTFAEVEDVTDSALVKVPGYGYLLDLPSGWTAVFCIGKGMTDSEPSKSDEVAFICQR